ncbi:F14J16.19 [Arabidopsis thaliana]|uniref:F14J16.19 n=1 Tax=Arabidopsis thaliana TaxID=3702 RepID=Q9LG19_ARATH|nr:F14J16.19 [Arabidopsis thaliana]
MFGHILRVNKYGFYKNDVSNDKIKKLFLHLLHLDNISTILADPQAIYRTIKSLVNCGGQFFYLVGSLALNTAFRSNESFLFVDVLRVEENGEVEPFAMSPTGTIGKNLEKGEKSAATTDQENDLALVDDENESHKDDVRLGAIVQGPSAANKLLTAEFLDINQSADVENEGLNKDGEKPVTNILVLMAPVPNNNFKKKIGTKNNGGKDADHEATTSLKVAKKGRTKKEKAPAKKDTKVASSSWNVDHDVVIGDPQENVDKVVRKSSKKSKKKQSSDVVE